MRESQKQEIEMPVEFGAATAEALMGHVVNGAQRQSDGAGHYAENLRYSYLEGKDMVSQSESLGHRIIEESGAGKSRNTGPSGT